MSETPADKQLIYLKRFDKALRAHVMSLVTEDLIEEHRRKPLGQHSDALDRILNYVRRQGGYGLYAKSACREYQIIALPVKGDGPPVPVDDTVYTDKNEAMHAVFLKSLEALQAP